MKHDKGQPHALKVASERDRTGGAAQPTDASHGQSTTPKDKRPLVRSKHTAGIPMNDPNSVF